MIFPSTSTRPSQPSHPTNERVRPRTRNLAFALAGGLLLHAATVQPVQAQELIPLQTSELQRLAIVFAPVQAVASSDGDRVPATVISQPNVPATLNALFEGQVQRWHVQPGAAVKAGDIIATLRSEDLLGAQLAYLEAASALASAEASLARDQQMFDTGIISAQRFQATVREHQQAAATAAATERLLQSAGITRQELTSLSSHPAALGEYTLRAPEDGLVMQRLVDAGQRVTDGDALAAFRSKAPLWVSARVPARLATRLSAGDTLTLEGYSDQLTLRQIDQQIDRLSQTLGVYAEFNTDAAFIPGQLITLVLPPSEQGVRVPSEAVVHTGDETTVYVRTPQGAEARTLALRPSGRHYIAQQGLRAGDEVAVQGAAILKGIQLGLGGGE